MSQSVTAHRPPTECFPAIELPAGVMQLHLMAWLPQGIIGPKMATFITDQDARVLEVRSDRVRLQIGHKRWRLGRADVENFALELTISLNHQTVCARSATHLV